MKSVERGDIMTWDYSTLSALVADRGLHPAKRLTAGQLRIATVPRLVRPDREGDPDPDWLTPLSTTPAHAQ